jgi:molybdenum cofactor synthesis domain-containing protein
MQAQNLKLVIGLLATGNELTEGDILNTNGQIIARQLTDFGFSVGMHVMTSDTEQAIVQALQFLLIHHSIIIITGGLGPTTDDRTRFALSTVINKPVIFNETVWNTILERYKRLGIQAPPHPSNQQQALFPLDAVILPNNNGSAAGCYINYQNKIIYMLPGPPNECLPMFIEYVLPHLLAQQNNIIKKLKWRLLGVIESDIAAKVEEAVKDYPVITGYRVDYPYLDVKIYLEDKAYVKEIENKINTLFSNYMTAKIDKNMSESLKEAILHCQHLIIIEDHATHGQLQAQLINPLTFNKISFTKVDYSNKQVVNISIHGLKEFWAGQPPTGHDSIYLQLSFQDWQENINLTVPFRSPLVVKYAVEYIAREILNFLEKIV